jgi:hypothetical protein
MVTTIILGNTSTHSLDSQKKVYFCGLISKNEEDN